VHVADVVRDCGAGPQRAATAWRTKPAGDEDGGLVVVGLLAAVAAGVAIYLYVKAKRRRRAAEENEGLGRRTKHSRSRAIALVVPSHPGATAKWQRGTVAMKNAPSS
jgi:hypothetical protein